MLKIVKMLVVAVAAGTLMAGGVYANDAGGSYDDRGKKHGEMFDKMAKELNLTAEQQAKLNANKEANRAKMQTLREAMKANRTQFREAVKQPGATRASVGPIVAQMKTLQGQMADQMVDGIFAAKEVLTPEQFAKMQNKMDEKMKDRKEKRGAWRRDKNQ